MSCALCTEFEKKNVWATTGCKTLRSDKVKEHEETSDHLNAITLKLEKENTKKCSENYNNSEVCILVFILCIHI